MGLLGLRKFIDGTGSTRLLPVPLSEEEALAQAEQLQQQKRRASKHGYGGARAFHRGESAHGETDKVTSSDDEEAEDEQKERREGDHTLKSNTTSASPAFTSSPHDAGPRVPLVDHVLVDMNCIVHSCFGKHDVSTTAKKELIQLVLERLRLLLTQVVVPRKSLTICLDGPAPYAKLQTQRLRRRKVALMDSSAQQLTSLAITAGSLFLVELENAIGAQFKLNNGKGFLRKRCPVYLYGSTVMGEGESKIARALAFLASTGPAGMGTVGAAGAATPAGNDHSARNSTASASSRAGSRDALTIFTGRRGRSTGRSSQPSSASSGHTHTGSNEDRFTNVAPPYNPDDTVVVLGNDIDLVMTCLGATPSHNISIVGPSALQLISVSDIIYRWLRASTTATGSAGGDSFEITPEILPSIRIDFIFLFLLNGGDHYAGAGEVAMTLWRRYRTVRASYPRSSLVSRQLDMLDTDFLVDVLDASAYSGEADPAPGLSLLQSALWSLYTTVTGICPDYTYTPPTPTPYLQNLKAAAAVLRKKGRQMKLHFCKESKPLAPLEAYVALMPSESTLPPTIAAALRAPSRANEPPRQQLARILATSNDPSEVVDAARSAVRLAGPLLSMSERYLCGFTPPVQLNAVPPRQRLSRYEQHRMLATTGVIARNEPIPVVRRLSVTLCGSGFEPSVTAAPAALQREHPQGPQQRSTESGVDTSYFAPPIPYVRWKYPANTNALTFRSPFDMLGAAEDAAVASSSTTATQPWAPNQRSRSRGAGEPRRVLLSYAKKKLISSEAAKATRSVEVKLGYAVAEATRLRREKQQGRLTSEKALRAALRRAARLQQELDRCRRMEANEDASAFAVAGTGLTVAGKKRPRSPDTKVGNGGAGAAAVPAAGGNGMTDDVNDAFLADIKSFLGDDADVARVLGGRDYNDKKTKASKRKRVRKPWSETMTSGSNDPNSCVSGEKQRRRKDKGKRANANAGAAARLNARIKSAETQRTQSIHQGGGRKSAKPLGTK